MSDAGTKLIGMTEAERSEYLRRKGSADSRTDPVSRLVRDSTAEEFVEWLRFRGSMDQQDSCVVDNLRTAFQWHRLQGRLDRHPLLIVLAELWGLRSKVEKLERPPEATP